jgi:glutathione reductase (NADPH)
VARSSGRLSYELMVPALPGAELGITADGCFALTEQPGRVAVIGGS